MSTTARLAALAAVAEPLGALAPGRMVFGNPDLHPLAPAAFRLRDAVFVQPSWAALTADGELIVDDLTSIPNVVRRGDVENIARREDGLYDVTPGAVHRVDEPVLCVPATAGYFHWVFDVLARLVLFDDSYLVPLIVTDQRPSSAGLGLRAHEGAGAQRASQIPVSGAHGDLVSGRRLMLPDTDDAVVRPALDWLGWPRDRIAWVPPGLSYRLRDAVVVSGVSLYGYTHDAALARLRQRAGAAMAARRLYVSRADAGTRRLLNDADVFAALEPLGFERIEAGRLGFAEQVELFRDAELVAGGHGGGLTNLVWSQRCRGLVELVPDAPFLMQYRNLAECMSLPYARLTARPEHTFGQHRPDADFAVNPIRVRRAVEAMLAPPTPPPAS